jgi:hypothetical protein
LQSPSLVPYYAVLHQINASLSETVGDMALGLSHLDLALELEPQVPLLTQAIVSSVRLGDPRRARQYLEMAESSPRISVVKRWIFRKEIAGHRQLIELYESIGATPQS